MLLQMTESHLSLPNKDESSSSSSSRTPSPVPAKRHPNPIEPIARQSLDSDGTIEPSEGNSKRLKKPKQISAMSPSSEPNDSTEARLRGRAPAMYDMKYHPMDEVLRPNAHATLNAQSRRIVSPSGERSVRGLDNSKERETHPISNFNMKQKRVHFSMEQPTRNSPRFVCSDKQSEKRVKYNMEYHPIDDVLRSKPRKCHSVWLKNVSIAADLSNSTTLPCIDFDNPFTKPTSPEWRDLELFDRRVYILQRGAPLQGNTLPLEWGRVVETLVMEGFFTGSEFKAVGGLTALVSRYETIRLEIQGFFKSAPEPVDKRNWPIRYLEDLKVFEFGRGAKYWRHQRHSIVNPRSNQIPNREQAVTAYSEDFEDGIDADFVSNQHFTLPISAISYASEEASYEFALGGQVDGYNGEDIDRLPEDQDHSFEEAFDLLQPGIDEDSTVDTILDDPFVRSNAINRLSKQPQHRAADADSNRKSDRSTGTISDPKLLIKKRKRGSKAKPSAASFEILEDEPGGSPLIRKYVSMNPASPGTDIPKENFQDRRSPSEGDLGDNYRMIRLRSGEHLVAVPPSPQSNRFRAVRAVQPREPITFGSPPHPEVVTTEPIENHWMQAPTVTLSTPIRRSMPFTSVVDE